jgi:uncharacterized SAM-binding protein YcdF (DUF218 family)
MIYYVSKVFWLIAAPTNALVLIFAIAAFWAVLRRPNWVAWLAAAVACGLVVGAFTPIGLALKAPLENRFPPSPPNFRVPPDGIILLGGGNITGIEAVLKLSKEYPKARLIFSGFNSATDKYLLDIFVRLGGDPERLYIESRPRTTSEDALYTAAVLKPKPSEKWLLFTSALRIPRAVGCFRAAGFQVEPYRGGYRRPNVSVSILNFRSWLRSPEPSRYGREGVDRPRCLPADAQDRHTVSGAVACDVRKKLLAFAVGKKLP